MKRRIPFGQEQRMFQLSPTCTGCGAPISVLHRPGCECEECPQCGKALVYCGCRGGLLPSEEFFYTACMAANIGNHLHVGEVLRSTADTDNPSLFENAAMLSMVVTRPDFFDSGLVPSMWDGAGKPEFTDVELKRALLFEDAEINLLQELRLERQSSPSACWC